MFPGPAWALAGDDLRDLNMRRDLRIAIGSPFNRQFGPFFPNQVAYFGVDHLLGLLTNRSLYGVIEPCNRSMLVELERLLHAVVHANDEHFFLRIDAYQLARDLLVFDRLLDCTPRQILIVSSMNTVIPLACR